MKRKIDNHKAAQMKADYLLGMSVKEIALKYNVEESEVAGLRTRRKWVTKAKILDDKINESLETRIIQEKLRILEKLHSQSEVIIDNAYSKLKDKSSFEPVEVFDKEGNVVGDRTNFKELKALADIWNLGFTRLLRSVGEPDTAKSPEESPNNPGERPMVQVLLKVGIKNDVEVEIANGKKAKKSKA